MRYPVRVKKTGRIARLSERFGRWDDAHADNPDPDQPSDWRNAGKMWIATKVFCVVLLAAVSAVVGPPIALGVLGGLTLIVLVWYCIWRRRRNKRLTGSPWKRPAQERQPDSPTP
jgi:Flp pilus assembly protein TadB